MNLIAPHVVHFNLGFVNAYAIQSEGEWVLVDTGIKPEIGLLKKQLAELPKTPRAILLTHGHIDHIGAARQLAQEWDVKIYVHKFEAPYLRGKETHPPKDPTVGGMMSLMARFSPWPKADLGDHLEILPSVDHHPPFLPDWKTIETPGHSPGHVSFFDPENRILIAGDAISTIAMDSLLEMATQKQEISYPGAPFTCDWHAAHQSVYALADLEPAIIAAGHGIPMKGGDLPERLREFARYFPIPTHGRYVSQAAQWDENGITYLPPAPPDDFALKAGGVALGVAALALGARKLTKK